MADTRQSYTNNRATEYNNTNPFDTKLKVQGYKVGTLSYPDGLGVYPDLQHYVAFFINVRGKSKFVADESYKTVNIQNSNNRTATTRDNLNNRDPVTRAIYGGAVAVGGFAAIKATGALLGISSQARQENSTARQVGIVAAKAVGLALGGLVVDQTLGDTQTLKQDKTKRLQDVITLHMQERPSVSYGINYQDKDLGILGGFLGSDTSMSDAAMSERKSGLGQSLALQIAKIPSILPGLGSITDIIQLGGKVKTNPFREVFFEGIDYRKFNFKYKFMPKNNSEVVAVYNIINKFKEHMHPELAAGGAFYLYPSEFEISYYYNNKENGYFNKIATCALTDMNVEYGGEQFSSFSTGAPTEINVTLSFRELELITKETIKSRGY
jgi:hypothetical protein